MDFQWQMQEESEKLSPPAPGQTVNEAAALAQVERVLGLEREVKRTQISLLGRLKNLLTEPQQQKLAELRKRAGS